jgi:hypothetical protein
MTEASNTVSSYLTTPSNAENMRSQWPLARTALRFFFFLGIVDVDTLQCLARKLAIVPYDRQPQANNPSQHKCYQSGLRSNGLVRNQQSHSH